MANSTGQIDAIIIGAGHNGLVAAGYLARAALIADLAMRAIGLNGKAFIPLLSAYACAVPAIASAPPRGSCACATRPTSGHRATTAR